MNSYKDFNDACVALYKLNTFNENDIYKIYLNIKKTMIETKILSPYKILIMVHLALTHNIKYFNSYKEIFKKIYEEYHPNLIFKEI